MHWTVIDTFRLASLGLSLMVFTVIATVVIVMWTPIVPEAAAVEFPVTRGKSDLQRYYGWHVSWRQTADAVQVSVECGK